MIATIRSLLGKELQQHRFTFLWLAGFTALVTWLFFRISDVGGQTLSYLSITSLFAVPVLVVIAFVVGQRLISAEYYGQTQRFIEALPIRQGYVQWVKYWVGLLSLLVLIGGVWLACIDSARQFETIRPGFIGLMAIRLFAFVFALWSTVFTFSLLGRLRIPLLALAAFGVSLINSFTQFELDRFGPLALVDRDLFGFERTNLPVDDLIDTLIFGFVMLALGLWLARKREGSFVESLATPINTRAKGFLVALVVTTLGIYTYFGPEPEVEPFAFSGFHVASDGPVEIAYLDAEFEADAHRLMRYVAERARALDALVPVTGDEFRVRVALDPSADLAEYGTEITSPVEGVVVSANFETTSEWSDVHFGSFLFHQVLYAKSNGRLLFEPHHWLIDGFARWWAASSEQPNSAMESHVDPIMLEALYATRSTPVTELVLEQWDSSAEIFGEDMGMSVAYSGWRVIQEQKGTAAALQLAKQEFSRPSHGDVRDWWGEWRDPVQRRFERATGWTLSEFVATWDRTLNELRAAPHYRRALDAIAKGELSITAEITENGTRALHYVLTLDRSLPGNTKCMALHTQLPSFDTPIGREGLREAEVLWPEPDERGPALSVDYSLAGEYGTGTRVYAAFECRFPQFPVPLYLGSSRLTMP